MAVKKLAMVVFLGEKGAVAALLRVGSGPAPVSAGLILVTCWSRQGV